MLSFESRLKILLNENCQLISPILPNGIHQIYPDVIISENIFLFSKEELIELYDPEVDNNSVDFQSRSLFSVEEDILLLLTKVAN